MPEHAPSAPCSTCQSGLAPHPSICGRCPDCIAKRATLTCDPERSIDAQRIAQLEDENEVLLNENRDLLNEKGALLSENHALRSIVAALLEADPTDTIRVEVALQQRIKQKGKVDGGQ